VRFGLQVETYEGLGDENAFDRMLAVARLAEAEGFESIWYRRPPIARARRGFHHSLAPVGVPDHPIGTGGVHAEGSHRIAGRLRTLP
jgi:hypothetical protein